MSYQIITDSACDLPREMLQEKELTTAALIVNFRGNAHEDSVADDRVKELYDAMQESEELYAIGDCKEFHNVHSAVWDAFEVANHI